MSVLSTTARVGIFKRFMGEKNRGRLNPLVPEIFFGEFFDENLGGSSYLLVPKQGAQSGKVVSQGLDQFLSKKRHVDWSTRRHYP